MTWYRARNLLLITRSLPGKLRTYRNQIKLHGIILHESWVYKECSIHPNSIFVVVNLIFAWVEWPPSSNFKISGLSYRHIQGVAVTKSWPIDVSETRCPQKKHHSNPLHSIIPRNFQWPQTRTCQTSCLVVNAANLLMRQSHTCLCPVRRKKVVEKQQHFGIVLGVV